MGKSVGRHYQVEAGVIPIRLIARLLASAQARIMGPMEELTCLSLTRMSSTVHPMNYVFTMSP